MHSPHPRRAPALARSSVAALVAALAPACSPDEPRWVQLSRGFAPERPVEKRPWVDALDGSRELGLVPSEDAAGSWVVTPLRGEDWHAAQVPGVFWAHRPIEGAGLPPGERPRFRLLEGERELEYVPIRTELGLDVRRTIPAELVPGTFAVVANRVYVVAAEEEGRPPDRMSLHVFAGRGSEEAGRWRVSLEEYVGDGLPVWPGESVEIEVSIPPRSQLLVSTVAQGDLRPAGAETSRITFRIELGSRLLLDHDQEVGREPTSVNHGLPMPADTSGDTRLRFRVEGGGVLTAFLGPRIAPVEIGGYGERPWGDARPDVVLFLADTFRADNLAAYGSERGLTPNLDRFIEGALAFERAWAPASWTLPSQASMMTGLFPREHAATDPLKGLAGEVVTVAEHLRDAGYRTGAVTDKGWVASSTGIDQGFELFREDWDTLEATLEEVMAFLAADDGRPVFLFVQSYHTHVPYRVSERTRRELAERYSFVDFHGLVDEMGEIETGWTFTGPPSPEGAQRLELYRNLYLGTVVDLDRAFGELLELPAVARIREHGALIFTSDHGEAFYEHETLGHGIGVWEESIAVPLALAGRGIDPAFVEWPASLVDLPRTIASIAGLSPLEAWHGRSLLELDADRPLFAFECNNRGRPSNALALLEGGRKLIEPDPAGTEPGQTIGHAYDIAADPLELDDLVSPSPAWADDLRRRLLPAAEALARPRVGPARTRLSDEDRLDLEALGY